MQMPSHRNRFFVSLAVAAAVSVAAGFARTYYLKTLFPAPSLPLLFHIHGAVYRMDVRACAPGVPGCVRRSALHRRVGWVGLGLVIPMLVTGSMVAIAAARGQGPVSAAVRRGELTWAPVEIAPLDMLLNNLTTMVLFGAFVALGVVWRSRPDAHKRFMALATIGLLPAAIGRAVITLLGVFHPTVLMAAVACFVLALVVHDLRSRGRMHPVTLLGGSALILSFPMRLMLAKTDVGQTLATWLIQ